MTKPRRPRALRPDERRLWAHVVRGVAPMKGKALPPESDPEPGPPLPAPAPAAPLPPLPPAPSRPTLPPLAGVERKVLTGLRRGQRRADAVIDLHGMRQAEAHGALLAFLHRSQAAGHQVVLVVTGKGGAAAEGLFEERGVLRRVVPHWLRLPDVRPLVLGFDEAAGHHGGSGALYVRLRRRRGTDRA
ncbi:MAG TPA: Smr/MutS family protein [Microvirga sp.]|jgi:DNA-nicking Smr family endonuclease|nr:Smr/MutS family protein [Microvirga sp.]